MYSLNALRILEMKKKASRPRISFIESGIKIKLPNRLNLKRFLIRMFGEEGTELESLTYVFCTDEYLLKINQDFLQHDYLTDIISFPLSEPGQPVQGEIYISYPRVIENASTYQTPTLTELHRVSFHGALHLCGYSDLSPEQKKEMTQMEDKYLSLYGIVPRGTDPEQAG